MKRIFFLLCSIPLILSVHAGDTLSITLNEAIKRGVDQSVDAMVARNEYISSYWQYRTYKAELLPEVVFNSTLPYYSKSYNQFQNSDGSYTYVGNDFSRIDAGLSITQNIPLTGAKLSIESSFERLQQYGNKGTTRFMALPASMTLEQPVFGFNSIKWLQKIEPLKYKEARLKFIAQQEETANLAIEYYFNLLLGQINLDIAKQNLENSSKLYTIAEARRKIGQISENDLLQLKVNLLNAESSLTDAQSSFKARMFQLRSFLGYNEKTELKPQLPDLIAHGIPQLNYSQVLSYALENNPFTQNIQRRMIEASRNVSQAKADRWNAKLFVSFGMSGQDERFAQAFNNNNWRSNQLINIGIRVPILDWGKGKGKVKVAEANKEVLNSKIVKEQMDFNQDVFLKVENFNNQSKQLEIAKNANQISQQRYETTIEAFILGKIDVLNLNDAQISKDQAKRNYITQMFQLWSYLYQIRALTLFYFINNKKIDIDYESIIK